MKIDLNLWFVATASLVVVVNAQPALYDVKAAAGADRCIDVTGSDCEDKTAGGFFTSPEKHGAEADDVDVDDRDEPNLREMPGYNGYKAYVRPDVSTFYQEAPGTRTEFEPAYDGQAFKAINMSPDAVELYWVNVDNGAKHIIEFITPWSSGGTASFPGHQFVFTKPHQPDDVLCQFEVQKGTSVYFCNPFEPNNPHEPARGRYVGGKVRDLTQLDTYSQDFYNAHILNLQFGEHYKNFTGGSEWLSMYPRSPLKHKMWRADYFGQEHIVETKETHFVKELPSEKTNRQLSIAEQHLEYDPLLEYREPGVTSRNLTIKALSCHPRAFEIRDFLSEFEADHILNVVNRFELERSTTGGHLSETRTSKTTWIPRFTDPILNAVFRRASDALRIDEKFMRYRLPGEVDDERERLLNKKPINEDLQIVHYDVGQQYTAHHDFGYPKAGKVDVPTRSINICMYLNNVTKGGQTSFPRWRNGETSASLDVTPEKGKAMIFYSTMPDGNLDDLSHHAALPVIEGEKWFANLWVHDPYRL